MWHGCPWQRAQQEMIAAVFLVPWATELCTCVARPPSFHSAPSTACPSPPSLPFPPPPQLGGLTWENFLQPAPSTALLDLAVGPDNAPVVAYPDTFRAGTLTVARLVADGIWAQLARLGAACSAALAAYPRSGTLLVAAVDARGALRVWRSAAGGGAPWRVLGTTGVARPLAYSLAVGPHGTPLLAVATGGGSRNATYSATMLRGQAGARRWAPLGRRGFAAGVHAPLSADRWLGLSVDKRGRPVLAFKKSAAAGGGPWELQVHCYGC